MKVIVDASALQNLVGSASSYKIHQLIYFSIEQKHTVLFEDTSLLLRWIDLQDPALKPVYRAAVDLASRASASMAFDAATVVISNLPVSQWADPISIANVNDAIAMLSEPLGIFVENADNDWRFLCGLMTPSQRERINQLVDNGAIVPLHGGGATLPARLVSRAGSPSRALRTFAMFDSDRRHPDELHESWVPTAPEACQGYTVETVARPILQKRFWMLSRRYIESYMPVKEIRASISGNIPPDAVDSFMRLSRVEQHYFNMKRGFFGDLPVENAHRKKLLFANISADDRLALERGFGRRLADRYADLSEREFDWDEATLQESSVAITNLMRLI